MHAFDSCLQCSVACRTYIDFVRLLLLLRLLYNGYETLDAYLLVSVVSVTMLVYVFQL